nr:inverse autotransporter beta domain-containing protein [Candidatus Regiella insecticola]
MYLPFYPQLSGKLLFEQYRGNDVDLWGKSQRQRNPSLCYQYGDQLYPDPINHPGC